MEKRFCAAVLLGAGLLLSACEPTEATAPSASTEAFRVLVFSKTAGYRHDSIPDGLAAIRALGTSNGFEVEATEDSTVFERDDLGDYAVVIFLNTSGDVLGDAGQAGLEAFVRAGGGFVGIHAASDTEYDWSWYGGLVGAYFAQHPDQQEAVVVVADSTHGSTAHLPRQWTRFDEWYDFRAAPQNVHVLARLDESTYTGGTMGDDHPIAWYHDYDGGRAWYTAMGHTAESFADPLFTQHLLGGILWAAGRST